MEQPCPTARPLGALSLGLLPVESHGFSPKAAAHTSPPTDRRPSSLHGGSFPKPTSALLQVGKSLGTSSLLPTSTDENPV